VTEPAPTVPYPGVDGRTGLRGVDGGVATIDLLAQGGCAGVQTIEVRREDDGRLFPLKLLDSARDLEARAHHIGVAVPQPGAVQEGLGEIHKGLARQRLPFGLAALRKAQRQVGQHHLASRRHQRIQHPTQHGAQTANPGQRQRRNQPHEQDTGMGHQTSFTGSRRGCL
jgi:hypothetical protein